MDWIQSFATGVEDLVGWDIISESGNVTEWHKCSFADDGWSRKQTGVTKDFIIGDVIVSCDAKNLSVWCRWRRLWKESNRIQSGCVRVLVSKPQRSTANTHVEYIHIFIHMLRFVPDTFQTFHYSGNKSNTLRRTYSEIEARKTIWIQLWGQLSKIWEGKKLPKFGAISDNFSLWSRISPGRIMLSTSWKRRYQPLPFTFAENKLLNFGPLTKKKTPLMFT